MPSESKTTRATELLLFGRIISGVSQHITTSVTLGGDTQTGPQIAAVFTTAIQADTDLAAAKAAYQQKLAAQQKAFTTARTTASSLKLYVLSAYGKTNPIVTDFGWSVAKAAVTSVAVKAEARVKAAATRVARHTMGSKQRLSIKGGVTPAESTVAAPVVTAPVATPVTK